MACDLSARANVELPMTVAGLGLRDHAPQQRLGLL